MLYFDPELNRFKTKWGGVINDIFRIITPNQFEIFREFKNQYLIEDRTNSFLVELIYPIEIGV